MSTPPRHGKPWSEEETQNLLQAIRRKESHSQISQNHQRSEGAIRSRLRQLAADYYFNDNRSIEEVMKFTGLNRDMILEIIAQRQWYINQKEKRQEEKKEKKQEQKTLLFSKQEPKQEGMVSLLIEIRDLMKELVAIQKNRC